LFAVFDSDVVVVTLAVSPIDVGDTTVGDENHTVIVAASLGANVPREALNAWPVAEHVPTVVVHVTYGSVAGSVSVTLTLSAGSVPEFVIVITKADPLPDVAGFGTGDIVRTKSGSAIAAGAPTVAAVNAKTRRKRNNVARLERT
jgi:hypothetical protein